jgi:putative ABC transport system permease protein
VIKHLLKLVWNRKRANALIVLEILVSFLVVFGVLAAAATFGESWERPVGFDAGDVLIAHLDFEIDARDRASNDLRNGVMRMVDEANAMDEVVAAAVSNTPPYLFSTSEWSRNVNDRKVDMVVDEVTDGFGEVMGLKVVRGRFFSREDEASPHQPVVLDVNTARAIWDTTDVVGRRMEGEKDNPEDPALVVVGVVEEYRKNGEASSPMNMMFARISRDGKQGRLGSNLVVKLRPGTPAAFEQTLVQRLQAVEPGISFRVRSMAQERGRAIRMRLAPLVVGGIIALFLVSMVGLGLTGVLWQSVTKRTREIGLRRAMGASGKHVHRQILLEIMLLATIALTIGSIVVLQFPLLGIFKLVTPAAFTIGFVAALVAIYALTLLCGLYPSWLASRLTPADALRYE